MVVNLISSLPNVAFSSFFFFIVTSDRERRCAELLGARSARVVLLPVVHLQIKPDINSTSHMHMKRHREH